MSRLTENHFSFKCPMSWEDMEVSAKGRFCGRCKKEVFDLTNCSLDEVAALQRKHGPICGSIRMAQAAAVAVSLSAAACQDANPPRTTGKPLPPYGAADSPFDGVVGEICPVRDDDDKPLLGRVSSVEAKKNGKGD